MGINRIEFELRSRQKPELKNSKQALEDKRANTPIRDVIAHFAGLPSRARPGSLIPCPFPDHKDGTASFMIYDKTNTCRCFGCNKGGSAIDFIMHHQKCSLADAIQLFLKF